MFVWRVECSKFECKKFFKKEDLNILVASSSIGSSILFGFGLWWFHCFGGYFIASDAATSLIDPLFHCFFFSLITPPSIWFFCLFDWFSPPYVLIGYPFWFFWSIVSPLFDSSVWLLLPFWFFTLIVSLPFDSSDWLLLPFLILQTDCFSPFWFF